MTKLLLILSGAILIGIGALACIIIVCIAWGLIKEMFF